MMDGLDKGIIPAYAGNTEAFISASDICRDHPRVCGEHCTWAGTLPFPWGSSPRMRGTHVMADKPQATPGIIPAYAGNTCRPTPA